ncbi:hypothetical protein BT96DRAFT_325073 [Gymnopus androsaceus JB14]|uniref:Uncharacterized protein n=1 Tax=Gymnopus androsaceus JB14 TaxID=1447944 RepID=A0A6A4GAT2_9AGAR|nr:hypothetical protein BT96DRAFT_1027643 [Gymnopus androsaceus JB14]KAE9382577.1 hypothetical protein BT96DRAFT_1027595 [Gymnopus androsaceus JB14]KAE9405484.1 hypothetical protein BT96DRAFT_325073 [Gymnopus androsaceus JB14]
MASKLFQLIIRTNIHLANMILVLWPTQICSRRKSSAETRLVGPGVSFWCKMSRRRMSQQKLDGSNGCAYCDDSSRFERTPEDLHPLYINY